ncbi:tripartite tricarboxylate transporter substrate binding protein [Anaerospora sp.]|uniref:tripartite tricarboxylate transporter substrate binding protein n=1 Tax=Anaerospora sp. TaxID=1960278 RepID=UPI00289ADD86|nr:tripartite tricarboxylate transporter substrate binding protein [Anaerospora sp.]
MQTVKVPVAPQYPERPITVIVPFSAGSGLDVLARIMEKGALKHLGQPLIIVNKAGGSGTIGWNEIAGSNPDGYTIGMSGIDLVLQPIYGVAKYNYMTALEPIAQIAPSPFVIAVQGSQPWQNIDQLINYARQYPGEIKFGHWGTGSLGHVIGEVLGKTANVSLEQVPFRGGSEAMAALLGGHIQIAIVSPAMVKEHIKSGTVKVLAVTSDKRIADPVFSNIPTFKEEGLDIVFNLWFGVTAPKELPVEVKNKLSNGFKAIITDPEIVSDIESLGLHVEYLDPQNTAMQWQQDNKKLTKTVKETGILDLIKSQKQ